MKKPRISRPFDATWGIRVKGTTQVDGQLIVVTSQIIRDKLITALDEMIVDHQIREYVISVTSNNIEEAEVTRRKK